MSSDEFVDSVMCFKSKSSVAISFERRRRPDREDGWKLIRAWNRVRSANFDENANRKNQNKNSRQ